MVTFSLILRLSISTLIHGVQKSRRNWRIRGNYLKSSFHDISFERNEHEDLFESRDWHSILSGNSIINHENQNEDISQIGSLHPQKIGALYPSAWDSLFVFLQKSWSKSRNLRECVEISFDDIWFTDEITKRYLGSQKSTFKIIPTSYQKS
jgi:hypothetical protein